MTKDNCREMMGELYGNKPLLVFTRSKAPSSIDMWAKCNPERVAKKETYKE